MDAEMGSSFGGEAGFAEGSDRLGVIALLEEKFSLFVELEVVEGKALAGGEERTEEECSGKEGEQFIDGV